MNFFLLPYSQEKKSSLKLAQFRKVKFNLNHFSEGREKLFFKNARTSIHFIIEQLNLSRNDEVFISTTSDSSFVSTCVSATIFNYAKLSRVLTKNTKLIFIIHEFGFFNHETKKLIAFAKENNIPTAEDCAHSFTTTYENQRAGTYADFCIYSLPKSLPIKHGGLLIGNKLRENNSHFNKKIHVKIRKNFEFYSPYIHSFSEAQKNNYKKLGELFVNSKQIYTFSEGDCPFVFGFLSKNYAKIYKIFDKKIIELGHTHNKNWVLLPTNAFISEKSLYNLRDLLGKYL